MRDINHPHTSGFNHIVFMLFIMIVCVCTNTILYKSLLCTCIETWKGNNRTAKELITHI